ncbi:MAM and LDL-receptor class A domain-containing protein 1-like [Lytechinus variegatus]|uniref:MAM and LDL-receptor class A domain-containing protein 1-like n=1 Tax=Lytechinus variegatus TaxID=7654 RepID=UPI001BB25D11|nr:MAM and LDL-receptor class A domain-containing protein 1-like [Lytechinus variegatus]
MVLLVRICFNCSSQLFKIVLCSSIQYDIDGTQTEIVTISGNLGDRWFGKQAEVPTLKRYRLVFEASVGNNKETGDIAIDDVDFRSGRCGHDLSCDFEGSQCLWENTQYGDYSDWLRLAGATSTWRTGPSVDHTTGTPQGYFIYFESNSATVGYSAWLLSPAFKYDDTTACFTFWYHMYGSTVGELNFIVIDEDTKEETYRWRLNGQQNPDQSTWLEGQFGVLAPSDGTTTTTPQTGQTLMIRVEAVLGYFLYGDIALDDLNVEAGTCKYKPEAADPSNQETINCDFDVNWCGWSNVPNAGPDDKLDWQRRRSGTPTRGTGPRVDHTTDSFQGHYLYFESSSGSPGFNALLRSVQISATPNGACFQFWLHMYGQTMGELEIYSESPDGYQERRWKQTGTLRDEWVYRQIDIVADYHYQLIFNAIRGVGDLGDIAIDDVFFDPTAGCPALEKCSFETDFCGWSQEKIQDDFDWSRSRGREHEDIPVDKTVGVDTGYYAWVNTTANPVNGDSAILFSPTYVLTSVPHCLRFFYYHDGIGALTIHSRRSGSYSNALWVAPPVGYKGWRFGSSTVTDLLLLRELLAPPLVLLWQSMKYESM